LCVPFRGEAGMTLNRGFCSYAVLLHDPPKSCDSCTRHIVLGSDPFHVLVLLDIIGRWATDLGIKVSPKTPIRWVIHTNKPSQLLPDMVVVIPVGDIVVHVPPVPFPTTQNDRIPSQRPPRGEGVLRFTLVPIGVSQRTIQAVGAMG
jgi:hypothetical protein